MSFGSGYFGQMPFGGGSSGTLDLTDLAARILALVVSLHDAAPTGAATHPRAATIPVFASDALVAAFGSSAVITNRRTTVTDVWLVSP